MANTTEHQFPNQNINNINKSVLVVGGAGYIGSHISKHLIRNGYTPVIVDRNVKNNPIAKQFNDGIEVQEELIRGDTTGWVESFGTSKLPNAEPPIPVPTKLCGRNLFQFRSEKKISDPYIRHEDCWIFADGRVLVKADNEQQAHKKLTAFLEKI